MPYLKRPRNAVVSRKTTKDRIRRRQDNQTSSFESPVSGLRMGLARPPQPPHGNGRQRSSHRTRGDAGQQSQRRAGAAIAARGGGIFAAHQPADGDPAHGLRLAIAVRVG